MAKDMSAQALIGRSVKVFWEDDDAWYTGRVTSYDEEKGQHHVRHALLAGVFTPCSLCLPGVYQSHVRPCAHHVPLLKRLLEACSGHEAINQLKCIDACYACDSLLLAVYACHL